MTFAHVLDGLRDEGLSSQVVFHVRFVIVPPDLERHGAALLVAESLLSSRWLFVPSQHKDQQAEGHKDSEDQNYQYA